jgi:hypothetical protein
VKRLKLSVEEIEAINTGMVAGIQDWRKIKL